jgi:hypothetical protein
MRPRRDHRRGERDRCGDCFDNSSAATGAFDGLRLPAAFSTNFAPANLTTTASDGLRVSAAFAANYASALAAGLLSTGAAHFLARLRGPGEPRGVVLGAICSKYSLPSCPPHRVPDLSAAGQWRMK